MDIGVLLNHTLIIQGLLFLLFLFLVNLIYIKPYSRTVDQRNARILELNKEAEKLREEAAHYLKEAEKILAEASAKAHEIIEKARKEAKVEADKIIEEAEKEAEEKIAKAKEEIAKEVEKAKAELEQKVEVLAKLIVEKFVGESK